MNFKHVEILQPLRLIMNLPSLLEMPEPFLRDNGTGSVGFIPSVTRCCNISIFSTSDTCGTLNETFPPSDGTPSLVPATRAL